MINIYGFLFFCAIFREKKYKKLLLLDVFKFIKLSKKVKNRFLYFLIKILFI